MILGGGQAFAFWVLRYDLIVPEGVAAISSDTDVPVQSAADREAVHRMAKAIHGRTLFPSRRALTALVGPAVLDVNEDEFVNVDVIHEVIGITETAIRARAVRTTIGDASHGGRVTAFLLAIRSWLFSVASSPAFTRMGGP
ncbi:MULTISPECIES: hypothetical protein [unclassified Variovorax]|uniref:hypothetical protein n=1 Tax=unclassified Variovorax TaxID=663243 RepID=UPI000BE412E8|nr:hypothetical protein [Variovorax sp. YR752]